MWVLFKAVRLEERGGHIHDKCYITNVRSDKRLRRMTSTRPTWKWHRNLLCRGQQRILVIKYRQVIVVFIVVVPQQLFDYSSSSWKMNLHESAGSPLMEAKHVVHVRSRGSTTCSTVRGSTVKPGEVPALIKTDNLENRDLIGSKDPVNWQISGTSFHRRIILRQKRRSCRKTCVGKAFAPRWYRYLPPDFIAHISLLGDPIKSKHENQHSRMTRGKNVGPTSDVHFPRLNPFDFLGLAVDAAWAAAVAAAAWAAPVAVPGPPCPCIPKYPVPPACIPVVTRIDSREMIKHENYDIQKRRGYFWK